MTATACIHCGLHPAGGSTVLGDKPRVSLHKVVSPCLLWLKQPVPVQAGLGQRSPLTEVRLCTVGLPETFPEPSAKVCCPA